MADRPPTPAFAGMLPASMARIDRTPRVRGMPNQCKLPYSSSPAFAGRLQGYSFWISSVSCLRIFI